MSYFYIAHENSVWKSPNGKRWVVAYRYKKYNDYFCHIIDNTGFSIHNINEKEILDKMILLGIYEDYQDAIESHTFRGK